MFTSGPGPETTGLTEGGRSWNIRHLDRGRSTSQLPRCSFTLHPHPLLSHYFTPDLVMVHVLILQIHSCWCFCSNHYRRQNAHAISLQEKWDQCYSKCTGKDFFLLTERKTVSFFTAPGGICLFDRHQLEG